MSGEFGSYAGGYFHTQMDDAASDCAAGQGELTRLWGAFLKEFVPVAREISWYEAADSGYDAPVMATIKQMGALKDALRVIEIYVADFQRVAERAVRAALAAGEVEA